MQDNIKYWRCKGEYDVILFLGSLEPGGANSHIIIN